MCTYAARYRNTLNALSADVQLRLEYGGGYLADRSDDVYLLLPDEVTSDRERAIAYLLTERAMILAK